MKTLFESLESLAEEIFNEGFADNLKADTEYFANLLAKNSRPSVTSTIKRHLPKDIRKEIEDNRKSEKEASAKKENQPVAKSAKTATRPVDDAPKDINNKKSEKTTDTDETPEDIGVIKSTKVAKPKEAPEPLIQGASEFGAKSRLGSPTKMAVLSFMRWAYTGFSIITSDDFIIKFRKEFSTYQRKTGAKFFYKLGTGQWAHAGIATFEDMDYDKFMRNQRQQTLGYQSKHGPVEKIEEKDLNLKFVTREGQYKTEIAKDKRGNIDEKKVRVSQKKFVLSSFIIRYVIPLPVVGGYKKSAFYIRLKGDVELMPGVFAHEVFLMDASKFNDDTLDDTTRVNNYSAMFDRYVTMTNDISLFIYRAGLNNNVEYGMAYQDAISRIEDNLKQANPNYQPNFTDINVTLIKDALRRSRALTADELRREFPKIYIDKITNRKGAD